MTSLSILLLLCGLIAGVLIGRYFLIRDQIEIPIAPDNTASELFSEALNTVDLCVVIYDSRFQPKFWNEATGTTFPTLVPLLKAGKTLDALIATSYQNGITFDSLPAEHAKQMSHKILQDLKDGRSCSRIVKMADGRIFEAMEFRLSSGYFASVRKDVSKVNNLTEQVARQNRQLAMSNERMQHFSAMAAHDLRAPLVQQLGLLTAFEEDAKEAGLHFSADMQEHLDLAHDAIRRMRRLVDDLLEYARIDQVEDCPARVHLSDRLDDVLQLVAIPDGFHVRAVGEMPVLDVPEAAIDIVLRNLIANAIHHHDRDRGEITVSAQVNEARALIKVTDDGPGIPDAFKLGVFDPFKRLELGRRKDGSGLGLAMVARTIEAWGGTIHIRDALSRGAVFEFSAPVAEPVSQMNASTHDIPEKHQAL